MREEHSWIESALRFGPLDATEKASLIAADGTTPAPKLAIRAIRSPLIQSGMKMVTA